MAFLLSCFSRPFPQLEQDKIRVLVFRDCDRRGKTLLFDSNTVACQQVRKFIAIILVLYITVKLIANDELTMIKYDDGSRCLKG